MSGAITRLRQLLGKARTPARANAKIPDGQRIYAIGDVHGRADLLQRMHRLILRDAASHAGPHRVQTVYLGDYIDRGLDSKAVIDLLLNPLDGFDCVHLKGNHEDALLLYLDDYKKGMRWFSIGGDATIMSYGVRVPGGMSPSDREAHMWSEFRDRLPPEHLEFLSGLKVIHRVGDYTFVHAGVRPGTPIDEQDPHDLFWIRKPFLDCKDDFGTIVVHGHSTAHEPEIRNNRIGIDTAAYATNVLTCLVLEGETQRFLTTDAILT